MFIPQLDFMETIKDSHKYAIKYYTGGQFDLMNEKMRLGKEFEEESDKVNAKLLLELFDKVPILEHAVTTYRGSGYIDDYEKNQFTVDSFISTTLSLEMANNFTVDDCCILVISIPAGFKALPLWTESANPEEEELLLPPRTTFRKIKEVSKKQKRVIYYTIV